MRIIILIMTLLMMLGGCANEVAMLDERPDDFGFSVSYGIGGKQKIDTFENIVQKDLVADGTIEVELALTNEDLDLVYEKMKEIPITKQLKLNDHCAVEPAPSSSWLIQYEHEEIELVYEGQCSAGMVAELYELEEFIYRLVSEKEAYKRLPEARGGYE
ncbi:hypothetical protein [Bacillus sp. JCM 19041]|uniref:hypothetical protein n=1 Tax=Bacillus sp. JCM 19041 TaxID=1460637 RepID=UPI0012E1BD34